VLGATGREQRVSADLGRGERVARWHEHDGRLATRECRVQRAARVQLQPRQREQRQRAPGRAAGHQARAQPGRLRRCRLLGLGVFCSSPGRCGPGWAGCASLGPVASRRLSLAGSGANQGLRPGVCVQLLLGRHVGVRELQRLQRRAPSRDCWRSRRSWHALWRLGRHHRARQAWCSGWRVRTRAAAGGWRQHWILRPRSPRPALLTGPAGLRACIRARSVAETALAAAPT